MSTGTPQTFYVVHFSSTLAANLLTQEVMPNLTLSEPALLNIDVPLSVLNGMFLFHNGGNVGIDPESGDFPKTMLVNADSRYKFVFPYTAPLADGTGEVDGPIDFSTATIVKDTSPTNPTTLSFVDNGDSPGDFFVKHIVNDYSAGATLGLFDNVSSVIASTDSKTNISISTRLNGFSLTDSAGVAKPITATGSTNNENTTVPTYRLLVNIPNSEFTIRFTPELMAEAAVTDPAPVYKAVPLVAGDKIVFKLAFTPDASQKKAPVAGVANSSSNVSALMQITAV
jgi:hypothetical protein